MRNDKMPNVGDLVVVNRPHDQTHQRYGIVVEKYSGSTTHYLVAVGKTIRLFAWRHITLAPK